MFTLTTPKHTVSSLGGVVFAPAAVRRGSFYNRERAHSSCSNRSTTSRSSAASQSRFVAQEAKQRSKNSRSARAAISSMLVSSSSIAVPVSFGSRPFAKPSQGLSPSQLAWARRFGRLPKATVPTAFSTVMGITTMGQSFAHSEWKDRDSRGKDSTDQGDLALIGEVPTCAPMPADLAFICVSSSVGAMRYAVQRSGDDDFEVADKVGISHSYMCKVLKGTAGLHGSRLVKFMRVTKSLAPLQWLAEQMGCDVVLRDSRAAEVAALRARLRQMGEAA